MQLLKYVAILLIVTSAGCERHTSTETRLFSEAVVFSDSERQARFTAALSNAQVPFKIMQRHGKEFVQWDAQYSAKVQRNQ